MKWVMRVVGTGVAVLGLLVMWVAIDTRLAETRQPLPPLWIAVITLLGFGMVLAGIAIAVEGRR